MVLEKADLVLHEGGIFGHPESDSVAILDGAILAHGKFNDLKPLVGPRTHLVKLQGRAVAPGFIDSHLHFLEAASAHSGISVWKSRTIPDLLAELRVAGGKIPPGNWLRAFGCDEALLREGRGPTREELDQAVAKNPLRLRHSTLHASWLNSRAIAALGLEHPDFRSPEGGLIVRDASGRATGLVAGMEEYLTRKLPLVTAAEAEARARLMSRELAATGVTSFTDATVRNDIDQVAFFGKLAASGAIAQHFSIMIGAEHVGAAQRAIAISRENRFRIAGVKFMPYAGSDLRIIARQMRDAIRNDLGCAFHATEVEELDVALQAIERAREEFGPEVNRRVTFRIEHGGMIPPEYPERIANSGAWIVTNPGFIYYRGAKYVQEPGLIPYTYRLRSLLDAGIALAAATDAPVTPARPLCAISAAASRVAIEGYELEKAEKLDIREAFALFTSAAARLAGLNAGSIEPGVLADLVVLSRDPLASKPAELMNINVDITIVGGRIIYERGRPAFAQSASADMLSS